MKIKLTSLIVLLACVLLGTVSLTYALLYSMTRPVVNTFTVGDIQLSLAESQGDRFQMIPGTFVTKDPRVTVMGGSESCWLFVKLEKSNGFDDWMSCSVEEGWTALSGETDVYYRLVEASEEDTVFKVLKDDTVTVKDTVTKDKMAAIKDDPTLTFTAYAVQEMGISTAEIAWNQLNG